MRHTAACPSRRVTPRPHSSSSEQGCARAGAQATTCSLKRLACPRRARAAVCAAHAGCWSVCGCCWLLELTRLCQTRRAAHPWRARSQWALCRTRLSSPCCCSLRCSVTLRLWCATVGAGAAAAPGTTSILHLSRGGMHKQQQQQHTHADTDAVCPGAPPTRV